jgi:hypothetical protein
MTRMYVNTKIRLEKALENRDAGQGTLEYLGIVVIAAILITALILAFKNFDLGTKIKTQLDKITGAVG